MVGRGGLVWQTVMLPTAGSPPSGGTPILIPGRWAPQGLADDLLRVDGCRGVGTHMLMTHCCVLLLHLAVTDCAAVAA